VRAGGRGVPHAARVEERTPGSFILAPFVGEGERTIFLSGTIHLISSTYPLSEGAPLEADSLTLLQQELDSHTGWMLQLPSDDGR